MLRKHNSRELRDKPRLMPSKKKMDLTVKCATVPYFKGRVAALAVGVFYTVCRNCMLATYFWQYCPCICCSWIHGRLTSPPKLYPPPSQKADWRQNKKRILFLNVLLISIFWSHYRTHNRFPPNWTWRKTSLKHPGACVWNPHCLVKRLSLGLPRQAVHE